MSPEQTSPLFTVIIPTLGKTDIWLEAIHSLQSQTCRSWEVIAIDSGPEAVSRPLIEKLADNRIIYVNTAAGNPRLNWDTGYRHSHGEYIIWLDDDNYLLPHALETLQKTIEAKNFPDVVTGEHMHYRGIGHYMPFYRNQLVIPLPLFGNGVRKVDPRDIVRRLMGWPQKKPERARFHTSENAVHRRIVEELVGKVGEINFETTSTHTLRLGMVALSKEVYVVDVPIALIGQSGNAMTDTWPRIDSPVLTEMKYELKLSPLPVLTYANYRLENMLRAKEKLGGALSDIAPNMAVFTEAYRRELTVFNQTWGDWYRNWKQLNNFLRAQQDPSFAPLRRTMPKYLFVAFGVQTAKKLHLYWLLQKIFVQKRMSHNNAIEIPLERYGVTGMQSCAEHLPEIIKKELRLPYTEFITQKAS